MYCLKSGLSKTKIYNVIRQYDTSGIPLPSIRKCEFSHRRDNYWFTWYHNNAEWKVYFSVFHGECTFTTLRYPDRGWMEFNTGERFSTVVVPFEYLRDNGFLREVA